MELLKPDELTLDFTVYPRPNIDDSHVLSLCEVLKAGGKFDPLEIGNPGRLIIDGAHRWQAWQQERHAEPMPVVVKTYKDKKAMLARAIQLNIRHGKRLGAEEFRTCFERAALLGMQRSEVVTLLGITKEFATGLLGQWAPDGGVRLTTKAPTKSGFNPNKGDERATPEEIAAVKEYMPSGDPTIGDRWAGLACGAIKHLMEIFNENEGKEIPESLEEAMDELIDYWEKATK